MLTNTKQSFNIYSCSTRLLHGISNILLSVNQSAHSEQTYEMTDHEIHQKIIIKLMIKLNINKIANKMTLQCSH